MTVTFADGTAESPARPRPARFRRNWSRPATWSATPRQVVLTVALESTLVVPGPAAALTTAACLLLALAASALPAWKAKPAHQH